MMRKTKYVEVAFIKQTTTNVLLGYCLDKKDMYPFQKTTFPSGFKIKGKIMDDNGKRILLKNKESHIIPLVKTDFIMTETEEK